MGKSQCPQFLSINLLNIFSNVIKCLQVYIKVLDARINTPLYVATSRNDNVQGHMICLHIQDIYVHMQYNSIRMLT